MIDPVPDLLAAQLCSLGVEPGVLERGANPFACQADEIDAIAAAQRNGARGNRVDMAWDLHDARAYRAEGQFAQSASSSPQPHRGQEVGVRAP